MAMLIVHTTETSEQTEKDRPLLEEAHKKALRDDVMWELFGGTLTIEGRSYQVCESAMATYEAIRDSAWRNVRGN